MARKFFYVCAGLFLLAMSYQMGVREARAQASTNSQVGRFQLFAAEYVALDGKSNRATTERAVMRLDTATGAVLKYSTGILEDGRLFEGWNATDGSLERQTQR